MATAITMTPGPVPTWEPSTEADKQLKSSLINLTASTDPVMLTLSPKVSNLFASSPQEDQQKKAFLLQSRAYFDLKAYVMTGKDFPATTDAFDARIPKSAFKRLDVVDPNVYNETRDSLTKIGSTCNRFYDNDLHRLVQAGSVAKTWSLSTLEALSPSPDNPDVNLYKQLLVLCDLKYKTLDDQDDAFFSAKQGSDMSLQMLKEAADDGRNQAHSIVAALLKFRDDTKPMIDPLKQLIEKYTNTKVKKGDRDLKGYLAYLNADLADSRETLTKTLTDYNAKYDEWKTATGVAVGIGLSFGWLPGLGWISLAIASHKADKLHGAWKSLWDNYNQFKKDNEDEALLVEFATKIVAQFDGIDEKIQDAVKSVATLSEMFQKQAESYEGIRSTLNFLMIGSSSPDAGNRKAFVQYHLKNSISKLQQLHTASDGFISAILKEEPDMFKTT